MQKRAGFPEGLSVSRSPIILDATSAMARAPRHPRRGRPKEFHDAFEDRVLFYDVFWAADGDRILAVGPPPMNLKRLFRDARFIAQPSGVELVARFHTSLSVTILELVGAPRGTERLVLAAGAMRFDVAVQPNYCRALSGARVLFTMNKNNDLSWIRGWAQWHVGLHGTDSIVLFDNGSDRYDLAEIEAVLGSVAGLRAYAVIDFPHKFGPIDPAVRVDPYWSRFAQISSMGIVLRRFGAHAQGLLNCDIDELANPPQGRSLYEVVRNTRQGLLILPGRWVEPNRVSEGKAHEQFGLVHKDSKVRDSSPTKWVLDPRRAWVQSLDVHPYWHWVRGRPRFGKSFVDGAHFWHFRGINTGWKLKERLEARTGVDATEIDVALRERFAARKQKSVGQGDAPQLEKKR